MNKQEEQQIRTAIKQSPYLEMIYLIGKIDGRKEHINQVEKAISKFKLQGESQHALKQEKPK